MNTKKIHIHITDGKVGFGTEGEFKIEELINILCTVQYAVMDTAAKQAPTEIRDELRLTLYDAYNQAASTLLARFIPDKDLRPDITEVAILNEELRIMSNVRVPDTTD